jgi:ribosomal protein S27AE
MSECFRIPQLESKKARYKARYRSNCGQGLRMSRHFDGGFRCGHCQAYISTDILLSGVQNRNHCPYCLWSRHLDLYEAGDRLAACKAGMQPIGLTLKQTRKKYGWSQHGELMIIHLCTDCGKLSINRMAADDDLERVLEIFQRSTEMDVQMASEMEKSGLVVLQPAHCNLVSARLFGGRPGSEEQLNDEWVDASFRLN